jgi:hypothetical protein
MFKVFKRKKQQDASKEAGGNKPDASKQEPEQHVKKEEPPPPTNSSILYDSGEMAAMGCPLTFLYLPVAHVKDTMRVSSLACTSSVPFSY